MEEKQHQDSVGHDGILTGRQRGDVQSDQIQVELEEELTGLADGEVAAVSSAPEHAGVLSSEAVASCRRDRLAGVARAVWTGNS